MTADHSELVDALVPIAAELVGTVRDYGPADVAAVLARVPAGRHDALAVVLAAMVDPDRTPAELLAWTEHSIAERVERARLVAAGVSPRVADLLATGREQAA